MKIVDYQFSDKSWVFQKVTFQDINLIVGDSGTGKTKLLNTIFNLGSSVAQKSIRGKTSSWKLSLLIDNNLYSWSIANAGEIDEAIVDTEEIYLNGKKILERKRSEASFMETKTIKLPKNEMSISTLREEEIIKPLYEGFSNILRRRFFADDLERNSGFQTINYNRLKKLGESRDLNQLHKAELGLNLRLHILKNYFPENYKRIIGLYKETFSFIQEIKIIQSEDLDSLEIPLSSTPVFCIRERNSQVWLRLDELSSGMQKVLLILTDLFSLPEKVIYIIDEYENSLGVGAINVLPDALFSQNPKMQVLVTSHHPYIITRFPVENWYITHRKGQTVTFAYGEKLQERYEASKQDKYLQLVNDPFYIEGIE